MDSIRIQFAYTCKLKKKGASCPYLRNAISRYQYPKATQSVKYLFKIKKSIQYNWDNNV